VSASSAARRARARQPEPPPKGDPAIVTVGKDSRAINVPRSKRHCPSRRMAAISRLRRSCGLAYANFSRAGCACKAILREIALAGDWINCRSLRIEWVPRSSLPLTEELSSPCPAVLTSTPRKQRSHAGKEWISRNLTRNRNRRSQGARSAENLGQKLTAAWEWSFGSELNQTYSLIIN
jgi:hypothetical protein